MRGSARSSPSSAKPAAPSSARRPRSAPRSEGRESVRARTGSSGSDFREADQRDDLVLADLAVVELPQEGGELLGPPDLGVVVLDVARRELSERLHLYLVDHGVEDLLARSVARPDEHLDDHPFLVLPGLVAETDRRRLAARAQLVGHDRR